MNNEYTSIGILVLFAALLSFSGMSRASEVEFLRPVNFTTIPKELSNPTTKGCSLILRYDFDDGSWATFSMVIAISKNWSGKKEDTGLGFGVMGSMTNAKGNASAHSFSVYSPKKIYFFSTFTRMINDAEVPHMITYATKDAATTKKYLGMSMAIQRESLNIWKKLTNGEKVTSNDFGHAVVFETGNGQYAVPLIYEVSEFGGYNKCYGKVMKEAANRRKGVSVR